MTTYIIIAVVAVLLGLLVGLLLSNGQKNSLKEDINLWRNKCTGFEAQYNQAIDQQRANREDYDKNIATLKAEHANALTQAKAEWNAVHQKDIEDQERRYAESKRDYEQNIATLKTEHTNALTQAKAEWDAEHKRNIEALEQRFNVMIENVKSQMKNATSDMIKKREQEFSQNSAKDLSTIVTPLREKIKDMEEAMTKNSKDNIEIKATLSTKLQEIINSAKASQDSADKLSMALQHKSKVQGDYGELILNDLLDRHGLRQGEHYIIQPVLQDADGKTYKDEGASSYRPDVILHLDDKRDIIIDSKMSLTAFIDYVNADDEKVREIKLREHLQSIKKHVEELSAKDYASKHGDKTIDFVIMFVPISQALYLASQNDPLLWSWAMSKKVFIADEQTLYAAINIIQHTWTKIEQEKNYKEIYDLANEMLDRVATFLQEYDKIGENIKKAKEAYENGFNKLKEGGQSIPTTARKLIAHGAKATSEKKQIPSRYNNIDGLPASNDKKS